VRILFTLLLLGTSVAALAENGFPASVRDALEGDSCEALLEQYRLHRNDPDAAVKRALADEIFSRGDCVAVDAEVVRVQPIRGVNPFDPEALRGVFAP